MTVLVNDRTIGAPLIAQRKASGLDRYDEVWEGLYVMAPLANNEHTELQARLAAVLLMAVGLRSNYRIAPGANVSDRRLNWTENYRCPDVVVFAPDTAAIDHGTHWQGGPDIAVEIVSDQDRSRDKLDFYAKVGVRELLIVDREPWSLELFRHDGQALRSSGVVTPGSSQVLASSVLPLSFRLVASEDKSRPKIEAMQTGSGETWLV